MMTAGAVARERPTSPAPDGIPVVEATGVSKRYGPTVALHDARIRIMPGETHALVGRNGAGKSTFVNILTGLVAPDTGAIHFGGTPSPVLSDRAGWRERVACVYQHSTIIPDLTIAENLFLDCPRTRGGLIDWRRTRDAAEHVLERWGVAVPVDTRAGDLSVEARQLVEIARSLSRGARFIILDEPTAQLDGDEIRRLFTRIRELQSAGVTFLFISHHLQEVYDICQTVTVMRDARHIVSCPVADLPKSRLIEAMTGDAASVAVSDAALRARTLAAPDVLRVTNLAGSDFADVSFTIRAGEVVGLAGATSSGRTGVAETIAGLKRAASGSIELGGVALPTGDVKAAIDAGIGCVPKSRHEEGLVLPLSVGENATMTIGGRLGRFGFQWPARKRAAGRRMIEQLGIVTQGTEQPVSGLSGGNQQKVVMARALASDPRLLVLIDPTAGVDVKSKQALLGHVETKRLQGKAVLMSSSELEDLRICDRVLVMLHGRIVASHPAGWSDAALIAAMEGLHE
jgi:simple sugar transport system ATP-binding protein